jgi:hypothetical protein
MNTENNNPATKKVAAPKKGTAKTEVVIGASVIALTKTVNALKETFMKVDGLVKQAEDLSLEIADKEANISQLDVDFKEKRRELEVSLDIEMKAKKDSIVEAHLTKEGKVAVASAEFDAIRQAHATLTAEFNTNVAKEVAKAVAIAKSNFEQEARISEANFKAKEAENTFKITSLDAQLKAALEDSKAWRTALEQEREAGIKRAQAASIGSVNLTGAGR